MRTRTIKLFLAASAFIIALTSCQKEADYAGSNGNSTGSGGSGSTGNTNDIIGDYDFVGMVAHTQSTVTVADQGQQLKAVTVSDYATKDNVGTAKITSNQFIAN